MPKHLFGIEVNRNIYGWRGNMHFGFAQTADGLVRLLSFGRLHTVWALNQSRNATKKHFSKMKALRQLEQERV